MLGVNGSIRVSCRGMDPAAQVPENIPGKWGGESISPAEKSEPPSIFRYTLLAVGLALFIRFFIAAPYVVNGASMEPAFHDWNYLIVDKIIYDLKTPERGDVIVFRLPQDESRSLIKRVIGLPGETVRMSGSEITIMNAGNEKGFVLSEPYIEAEYAGRGDQLEMALGEEEYFVLGDNRSVSADSRLWGGLPESDITGRVDARLYPLDRIGILPGKAEY